MLDTSLEICLIQASAPLNELEMKVTDLEIFHTLKVLC